ncbi:MULTISPECIES: hypothetical protein [Enterobacter]|uniref:hypothetical protein n=1 Tax=Enterobacter TaxID=547 RepID=UPI0027E7D6C4|nr:MULTISPECIES: hypothetical protein [Enterobacter]MEB7567070.1 hypothetical protein [Enterobacter mori]HDT2083437.1 hypothetical protein [Enterobacter roggenkampii]
MNQVIVRTKDELERAQKSKAETIRIEGELANKVRKGKTVAKASGVTLAAIAAVLAATPFTGGLSTMGLLPVAAYTGFEIATIIAAASIGIALLVAVFKDYEEIEAGDGRLVLRRRSKN